MRQFLAATCLTPVALIVAGSASAETVISTARTTSVQTSTANNGAADDVRISSDGSIKPGSGVAVTIDSNNSANNQGTIQITGSDGATGILANPGLTGAITNSGTITLDEDYTATDADGDGDIDGPFSIGTGRYGIHVAPGGTFTGEISHSGTITIEGNNSAGIAVESALTGNLTSSGTITLTGDQGYGVHAGAVSGNVAISGTITTTGAGTVGIALDGDIGGAVTITSATTATGYRSTTAPASTSTLDADDLLQGGGAVRIGGNVGGGILFDTAGATLSYGAAPAVRIGAAARDIAIGPVAATTANGNGLVLNGTIDGEGVYTGVSATGLVIGGLGGKVAIAGGIENGGTIKATSLDSNAVALEVGAGTTTPAIVNSGAIIANGGAAAGSTVQGLSIEAGSTVTSLTNSGSIGARVVGATGSATAIADHTGLLATITNSGAIGAVVTTGGTATAIDLSANTSGATVSQVAPAAGATSTPGITGAVLFGSGNDTLSLAVGGMNGAASFAGGDNRLTLSGSASQTGALSFGAGSNAIALSGTSSHVGDADFGGGNDTLTLSDTASFSGAVSNARGLAVNVAGGALALGSGTASIGSLSVGAAGSLTVSIDSSSGAHSFYDVAGAASFAQGAKVNLDLNSLAGSEGSYRILHAATLTGADTVTSTGAAIPYLFDASLSVDQAAGDISVEVSRKTAAELGLNRSGAAAYQAIYSALTGDSQLGSVFLGIQDADTFQKSYRQMLPDHAGGLFSLVTEGSRALSRVLADPRAPMVDLGGWGFYLDQAGWGSSKGVDDTAPWRTSGWGASGGAEIKAGGLGSLGLSLSYLNGFEHSDANEVNATQYELAAYWRADWKGLHAYARGSGGYVTFDSQRNFTGTATDGTAISRTATGSWHGVLLSAAGGLSYELRSGAFTIRPAASLDYYRLHENGWSESGGGTGFDLTVDARSSDALAANATLNLGYDLQRAKTPTDGYLRLELEGGRRELVGGTLGATTASFEGGQDFTLLADDLKSSWIGRARLLGGNGDFQATGEVGAERDNDQTALSARISLQVKF